MRPVAHMLSIIMTIIFCSLSSRADDGILVLSVTSTAGEPVSNVTLKCKGDAPSGESDRNGAARLKLPIGAQPGQGVVLQVTAGDWALVSPWDGHVIVPSFDRSPNNFVTVVVAKRGDKQMLASGRVVEAIAAKVLKDAGSKLDGQLSDEERRLALETQAREYGLTPEEVDLAIREWSKKTTGEEQKGLAELYSKNFSEAAKLLGTSLEMKIKEMEELQNKAANTAYFLGQALYGKGQYIAAAEAFTKALTLRPEDGMFLYSVSASYRMAGNLGEAGRFGARAISAKTADPRLGPYHPATANAYINLALVYEEEGKYADAELIFKQALTITERVHGPDHVLVAECLYHYAGLLVKLERKAEAEEKRTLAGAIRARYERQLRERTIAESRRLLELKEQQLGPDHLEVAVAAGSLGSVYRSYGQLTDAELLFKRALAIKERTLGKDHFETAGDMRRLFSLYEDQSRYAEAEPLARRTLAILEKEFGQNNPVRILDALEDYARLLRRLGRSNEANGFELRAKEIRAKHNIRVPNQMNSPGVLVDPRQISPAAVNTANASPDNIPSVNPPGPGEVKEGTSTAPSTSRESKKPAKKKPRKRSSN